MNYVGENRIKLTMKEIIQRKKFGFPNVYYELRNDENVLLFILTEIFSESGLSKICFRRVGRHGINKTIKQRKYNIYNSKVYFQDKDVKYFIELNKK